MRVCSQWRTRETASKNRRAATERTDGRRPLTCDEVAQLGVEARVVVGAEEARHHVVPRDALQQGNVVQAGVEGRSLIVYVQN